MAGGGGELLERVLIRKMSSDARGKAFTFDKGLGLPRLTISETQLSSNLARLDRG